MAFSAEIEDKLADVVDDVSFVQRNTVKQAQITQFSLPPRPTLVIYTFDLYPEVSHISTMRSSCLGSTGHNSSCRGKTRRGLELKGDFGAVSRFNDFFCPKS
jgi:hypothetical protein